MGLTYTVDHRDGWLCVRESMPDTREPIDVVLWWAVRGMSRAEAGPIIGKQAFRVGSGRFVAKTRPGSGGAEWALPLFGGPDARAIAVEKIPIPCPPVRKGVETRWHNGRWEKYLKTQGWVAA